MPIKKQITELPPGLDRTALLVIDVQLGLFQKSTPVYQAERLIENINLLVKRAHSCEVPVIYIQHSHPTILPKDSPGWQLHPGLHPTKADDIVYKEHPNSFEDTNLCEVLDAKRVDKLVVTGLVTHGCVKATCQGGQARGYQVTLVGDAHSSYSAEAEALIEKWHANLGKEGVIVLPAAQVQFE